MATYVTEDELTKFATDLETYVQTAIKNDDVAFAGVVKEYVEGRLSDLETSIVNNEDWLKAKASIDALLQVFDENKDGTLSPEEVLAKIGEIKGQITAVADRVTAVEGKIDTINGSIGSVQTDIAGVKKTIEDNQAEIEAKLGASIDGVQKQIDDAKASLETAKADVEAAVGTKVEDLETKVSGNVNDIFGSLTTAIEGAFQAAAGNVCDRMNAVRASFGLPAADCGKAQADTTAGDGATL